MHAVASNISSLAGRLQNAREGLARTQGKREAATQRVQVLTGKVAKAKGRLSLDEEVGGILDQLQQRAHQRAVGAFEQLLSAILTDVLPEKGAVKLDLGTERGAPALAVQINNCGELEDALEGSGGAVTNVLSTGLRFAALSRTANRKLMVLDEPDCWLKPDKVPALMRVIAEVAEKARTQTILISHHEPSLLEGRVNLVRLYKATGGKLVAQVLEPHSSSWLNDEEPGLRSIRLINFRAHEDTLLPLFPGVTALVGDNDLGKSTLAIGALRAVAYGQADDSMIRHGATEARVIIELESRRRIEWVRKAKGSPRVSYALYEGDELVKEGRPAARGQVPAWVTEALGVLRVDDLDLQLASQKAPVFLLDESPSRQAQLLSVGRESGRLHNLIDSWGDLKKRDRDTVRSGESELACLHEKLADSESLGDLLDSLRALCDAHAKLVDAAQAQASLGTRIHTLQAVAAKTERLQATAACFASLPAEAPTLKDTRGIYGTLHRIARTSRICALAPALEAARTPELPVFAETDGMSHLIEKLARLGRLPAATSLVPVPQMPVLLETQGIVLKGRQLATLARKVEAGANLPTLPELPKLTATADLARGITLQDQHVRTYGLARTSVEQASATAAQAETELNELIQSLGGDCPLCGGTLSAQTHTH